jgi:putative hydrolase of the HAD superfamily
MRASTFERVVHSPAGSTASLCVPEMTGANSSALLVANGLFYAEVVHGSTFRRSRDVTVHRRQTETRFVLFDLGGVLIELGGVEEFGALIGVQNTEEIWRRWLTSPWVRRYERGQCAREFVCRFRDWPKGLLPGAADLVQGLAGDVTPACLSNTNEMHWNEQQDAEMVRALFEQRFLSHEIGLVKPDREIFDHVVAALGCRSSEILFLDDNLLNVQGAEVAGLDAHRVRGVEDSRALLERRGLSDSS